MTSTTPARLSEAELDALERGLEGCTSGPWKQYDDGGEYSAGRTYGNDYADVVWGPKGPGYGVLADCSPNGEWSSEASIANAAHIARCDPHTISRLIAELRSSRMSGTRVKALEWRDQRGHSFPDMWDARSQCGVYQIEERSASDQPAYVVTGPFYAFIADVDSLEEAKAAAQADYEARILSALAPRAEPEPVQAPRIKFDVAKYVESYEFRGDGWDHTPTEDEAALLVDALEGALYEIEASLSPTHPASKAGEPTEGQRSWRCFHCDETFTNEHDARLHFGDDESRTPACLLKGAEGSLLEALRRAERDASEAWHAVHSETIDAVKAYHAQLARHQEQLRSVEVLGYERGLADAKAHPETLGLTALAPTEENGRG